MRIGLLVGQTIGSEGKRGAWRNHETCNDVLTGLQCVPYRTGRRKNGCLTVH
jgi:hypothetical protein